MDSKLQIISGAFRGRKLCLPSGARPTQNRARIALFNMITSLELAPRRVWDAFAGSGAFGIECLSRMSDVHVTFTDIAPGCVKKNLAAIGADSRATVYTADALSRATQIASESDLIFIDPPYADADLGAAIIRKIGAVARTGAIVIWEQDAPAAKMPDESVWEILRDKQYGRARFLIMRRR